MPHRRVGLGAMPMALAGLDMHDIAHIDLSLLMLRGHHAGARGYDQYLVAVMRVPSRRAALAEVHNTAVVVRGLAGLDDRRVGREHPAIGQPSPRQRPTDRRRERRASLGGEV